MTSDAEALNVLSKGCLAALMPELNRRWLQSPLSDGELELTAGLLVGLRDDKRRVTLLDWHSTDPPGAFAELCVLAAGSQDGKHGRRYVWQRVRMQTHDGVEVDSWLTCQTDQASVSILRRPPHCDRGRFLALVEPENGSELALSLDEADGFPRYYFDEAVAQWEMGEWMHRRGLRQ